MAALLDAEAEFDFDCPLYYWELSTADVVKSYDDINSEIDPWLKSVMNCMITRFLRLP